MNAISKEAAARFWTDSRLRTLIGQLEPLRRSGAKLGPYVLLQLLLPGGTMFALLLFLYQRWKLKATSLPTRIGAASPPALMSTLGRGILAVQPERKGEERAGTHRWAQFAPPKRALSRRRAAASSLRSARPTSPRRVATRARAPNCEERANRAARADQLTMARHVRRCHQPAGARRCARIHGPS